MPSAGPVRAGGRGRLPADAGGRGDRRHHLLHQHLQPGGDDGRRAAGEKGAGPGPARKPWVKTSWRPARRWSPTIWRRPGCRNDLDALGFNLVGYGCTTCIGNSGPLQRADRRAIRRGNLTVGSVLSGNRNFEGRVHTQSRANWLTSPPLVVAFALAGTTRIDLASEPLGQDLDGQPVYLRDLWPADAEIAAGAPVSAEMFRTRSMPTSSPASRAGAICRWSRGHLPPGRRTPPTSARTPPSFEEIAMSAARRRLRRIRGARMLALLGDSITTDHISPAGAILADSPAGRYLRSRASPRPTSTPTARGAATTR
jgi:aconitate hydratase